jgi:hypothetical protein
MFTIKARVCSAILVCLCFASGKCQPVNFGLKFGGGNAIQKYDKLASNAEVFQIPEIHLGVFLAIPLEKHLEIQTELLYHTAGAEYAFIQPMLPTEILYRYVSAPVLLKFFPMKIFYLEAGVQGSVMLGSPTPNGPTPFPNFNVKGTDAAFAFGLGLEFPRGIVLGIRRTLGLVNISKNHGEYIYNNIWQFTIGYRFGKRRAA